MTKLTRLAAPLRGEASVKRFKRGERVYLSGFLTGIVVTGLINRRRQMLVELDMTRNRMWWPLDRITKDYGL